LPFFSRSFSRAVLKKSQLLKTEDIIMAKLSPELWGLSVNEKNHLTVGDADAVELAEKYGTPVYIVNEERLRQNYNRFYKAFKSRYPNFEVSYSYKTNCIPGVLNVLHEIGAKAEVISGYELWLAQRLSVTQDSIIFNGPNKTSEELTTAIKQGIKLINADSLSEIESIDRISAGLGLIQGLSQRE
jgi:diaminopimelate decarboxylase